jgi:hypothetical protein
MNSLQPDPRCGGDVSSAKVGIKVCDAQSGPSILTLPVNQKLVVFGVLFDQFWP